MRIPFFYIFASLKALLIGAGAGCLIFLFIAALASLSAAVVFVDTVGPIILVLVIVTSCLGPRTVGSGKETALGKPLLRNVRGGRRQALGFGHPAPSH